MYYRTIRISIFTFQSYLLLLDRRALLAMDPPMGISIKGSEGTSIDGALVCAALSHERNWGVNEEGKSHERDWGGSRN